MELLNGSLLRPRSTTASCSLLSKRENEAPQRLSMIARVPSWIAPSGDFSVLEIATTKTWHSKP